MQPAFYIGFLLNLLFLPLLFIGPWVVFLVGKRKGWDLRKRIKTETITISIFLGIYFVYWILYNYFGPVIYGGIGISPFDILAGALIFTGMVSLFNALVTGFIILVEVIFRKWRNRKNNQPV